MKRLALVAVFAVTGCSKAERPGSDTSMPAMAPAPMDSAMMAVSALKADSMRRADSIKAAGAKRKGTKAKAP